MSNLTVKARKIDIVCAELKEAIERAYSEGVTIPDAEKLAARTLTIRLELSDEIKQVALDARMKKHGVKAVRADVYMEELCKHDKKPAESFLEHAVNLSEKVATEETSFAEAEAEYQKLMAYLDVFKDAHLYFRNIAKGTFEG
jgi:hypothetical protein